MLMGKKDRKIFIIDIDGVICENIPNEEAWRMPDAEPIPGAKETINRWYDEGHYICFFTARTDEHKDVTIEWLRKHGFKYHQIIFNKPRGGNYHYIDDLPVRATRFKGRFTRFIRKLKEIEIFEE